ncbi:MAG: MFS transporter [Cytophagales bacterium]|nr:MFS transporter [Cytophagales bacterium]
MKNNRKIINAWCMFDWANSVYSLVITTTIFPIYYNAVTKSAFKSDTVRFFYIDIENTVLYSYSLSFSFLLIAVLSPLLSGIADFGSRKKIFMKFFTYLGGVSCILLYFFTGDNIEFGIILAILASVGFAGGIVFYNAYLPIIATPDKYDIVSAKGFSMGYAGSVLLLIFNLTTISNPALLGLPDESAASRLSFILVGIWWIGFSQITFYRLPKEENVTGSATALIKKGYLEIIKVARSLSGLKNLKRFLISFFFYNMGVQTVIYLAALFGDDELKLPADNLIMTILIIQIVAIFGSYTFAKISNWKGNKVSLIIMVIIWMIVCLYAYFLDSAIQFYILGFVVGMVMGGIQSLSRASYSKLIPPESKNYTSYFSFYDVLEKTSIVFGTFAYGMIEQITGSMRNSTLALSSFFIIGLVFLLFTKIPKFRRNT